MSRTFHKLLRTKVCRGVYRDKSGQFFINSWEATYFNFNEKKLKDIARAGKELGIGLFVLDDGLFGDRDNASSSLGDWYVNRRKLPNGLDGFANYFSKKVVCNLGYG